MSPAVGSLLSWESMLSAPHTSQAGAVTDRDRLRPPLDERSLRDQLIGAGSGGANLTSWPKPVP